MFWALLIATALVIYAYLKWSFNYWKRRGLPYVEPEIPFGNTGNLFTRTKTVLEIWKDIYDELKSRNLKHGGFYTMTNPTYMPVDLEYVKNVLTRDFQHFTDRGIFTDEEREPLTAHLFSIGGQKWRNLRVKITPTFTSGKMKMMFKTLVECADLFKRKMEDMVDCGDPIDIKDVLGRFTTDVIGSCAFGLDCNSIEDENSEFRHYGKKCMTRDKVSSLVNALAVNFPKLKSALGLKSVSKDIEDFFMNVVRDTVAYREKNNVVRNDFMQIMINLKNSKFEPEAEGGEKHDGKGLTLEEIAAQCFVFFLAGFETSSTVMTFALLEMARNPEVQEKARTEVLAVMKKHNDELTYEALNDMKYLGQVMDEAMRMYPPLAFLIRQCVKDYKVPDTNVVIEKGIKCIISVLGIHMDPELYDQPEIFDPERFSDEAKASRHPYAFLPFGEGPRNCVGLRFGLMQSKVGLSMLLKHYNFQVDKKTQLPIKLCRRSPMTSAEGGVWLKAERLRA